MSKLTLPRFFIFGRRPVKFIGTPDGGMDVLVFDWESGGFKRDLNYLSKYFEHSPEIEEVSEEHFIAFVKHLLYNLKNPNQKEGE
ncbi:MAG: hypothetical protein JW891_17985 [Candidatus Lokiarchaeota archaeon]|nr:hypothetical protein [Candidatus Lokiarchaeota archaeon]